MGGKAGRGARGRRYFVDILEPRRLLAASFGAPVVTALPAGLSFAGVVGGDTNEMVVKRAGGGGLLVGWNDDGTFTVKRSIDTTGEIIGFDDPSLDNRVRSLMVWTTAGVMTQQTDGTLDGPVAYGLPSDVVTGTVTFYNNGILFERFTPDGAAGGPGTVTLGFLSQLNSYNPEVDTVLARGVARPQGPLVLGDGGVVAEGQLWSANYDGTFSPTPFELPGFNDRTRFYRAYLSSPGLYGVNGEGFVAFPVSDGSGNDDIAVLRALPGNPLTVVSTMRVAPAGTTDDTLIRGTWANNTLLDFATAVTSGPGAPAVEVFPARGDGSFLTPELFPQSSPLLPFGAEVASDVTPVRVAMVCTQTTGQGTSLVTLFDDATRGPLVSLGSSVNPSVVGESVTLSAVVPGYAGSAVSFYDGQKKLGDAMVQDDQSVSLAVSGLSVGTHSITVRQAGSLAFTSDAFTQTVQAAPRNTPYVVVTGLSFKPRVTLSGSVPAGYAVDVSVTLKNLGGVSSQGNVSVGLVATTVGAQDAVNTPGAVAVTLPLDVPQFSGAALDVAAGKSVTLAGTWTVPAAMPQRYYVVNATIAGDAGTGLSPGIVNAFVFAPTIHIVWGFGGDTPTSSITYVRDLGGGDVVTFSLTGGGSGIVFDSDPSATLDNGTPDFQVVLYSTSRQSTLAVTQTGTTRSNIVSLSFQQATDLGRADLRQDTPHSIQFGQQYATDWVGKVMIGTAPPAEARTSAPGTPPADPGSVTVNGTLTAFSADSLTNCDVHVNGNDQRTAMVVDVGTIPAGRVFQTSQPVELMNLGSAERGSQVEAYLIGRLNVAHDFDADVILTQAATTEIPDLGTATIAGSISGAAGSPVRWRVAGDLGTIDVGGNIEYLDLYGGAVRSLTDTGEPANPPFTYEPMSIQNLAVSGFIHSSVIAAGIDPVDEILGNGNDRVLNGGSIGTIAIGGGVLATSFEAAKVPAVGVLTQPAAGEHLVFAAEPGNGVAGHKLAAVSVELRDAAGNLVTNESSTVTLKFASGAGTGSTLATAPLVHGVASFSQVVIRRASFYSLSAEVEGVAGTLSSDFTISPDRAYRLHLMGLTPSFLGHGLFYGAVEMLDRYGNRVHDSTATLRFRAIPASNPAEIGISTGVTGAVVFSDGLASFNLNIFETEKGRGLFVSSVPKVKPAATGVIRGPYSRSATRRRAVT